MNWRQESRGGQYVLTMIVLDEAGVEPDGDFGIKPFNRVRVLRLEDKGATWEVWEEGARKKWTIIAGPLPLIGEKGPLMRIPFEVVYGAEQTGPFRADPPLLELSLEALEHGRVLSSRQSALDIASVPIPVIFDDAVAGDDELKEVAWGAATVFRLSASSKVAFWEPSGQSLPQSQSELRDIEARMARAGLSLLLQPKRSDITATERLIDKAESDSALASVAASIERGLNGALRLHAESWLGLTLPANAYPWIKLGRDFTATPIGADMVGKLSAAVLAGQLSTESLWDVLARGEVITIDPEVERVRIEQELQREVQAL